MKKLLLAIVVGLSLGGCSSTSILQGGTSLTATINQPIGFDQMYLIESSYGTAQRLALVYFNMRQCRRTEVASLSNPCSRRSVKLRIQALEARGYALLVRLRTFRKNNDQINAISVGNELRQVLLSFQNEIQTVVNVVGVR